MAPTIVSAPTWHRIRANVAQALVRAAFDLGLAHEFGVGLVPDAEIAVEELERAVAGGCVEAAVHLGRNLYRGAGVARDFKRALVLLEFGLSEVAAANGFNGKKFVADEKIVNALL